MISALAFTLTQSFLSTIGSVFLGGVLALVLARAKSKFFVRVTLLPFFLPPLVVVLAILNLYGHNGLGFDVFGLSGIVLCHLVLNIPLAAKLFYEGYVEMPAPHVRLAVQFGRVRKLIDFEVFRTRFRRVFAIIFLYCFLSFTIVLTLGGGPRSTTLEVAIYQAIRYDYNLPLAFQLALLQASIGIMIYMLAKTKLVENFSATANFSPLPWGERKRILMFCGVIVALFIFSPLLVFGFKSIAALSSLLQSELLAKVGEAFGNSILLALITLFFTHLFSFALIKLRIESVAWVLGAVSPLAIATVLILSIREFSNPFHHGIVLVALLQAITYLPFVVNFWQLRLAEIPAAEKKLMQLYFPASLSRLRRYWLPTIGRHTLEISAIIFALSIGDLGLIPLFSPADFQTLPWMVWQLIGSYQIETANGVSLLIVLIVMAVLLLPQLWRNSNA